MTQSEFSNDRPATELGNSFNKYGSDKNQNAYAPAYEFTIDELKTRTEFSILEIGTKVLQFC